MGGGSLGGAIAPLFGIALDVDVAIGCFSLAPSVVVGTAGAGGGGGPLSTSWFVESAISLVKMSVSDQIC